MVTCSTMLFQRPLGWAWHAGWATQGWAWHAGVGVAHTGVGVACKGWAWHTQEWANRGGRGMQGWAWHAGVGVAHGSDLLLEDADVESPVGAGGHLVHVEAGHVCAGRVGAMRRLWNQTHLEDRMEWN